MLEDKRVEGIIKIENAKLMFRNFEGRKSEYNPNGFRSFCVILDQPDVVDVLLKDGWNIKYRKPQEEGDPPVPYLEVRVRFPPAGSDRMRPKIVTLSKVNGKTFFNEETVKQLDWAEFTNVDLSIRPYNWEVGNKSGVKAYLKTFYAIVVDDEFAAKYKEYFDESTEPVEWEDEDE